MTYSKSNLELLIMLMLLGAVPGIFVGVFYVNSLAIGLSTFAVANIIYFLRFWPSLRYLPSSLIYLPAIILLYSMLQPSIFNNVSLKSVISAPALFLLYISAYLSATALHKINSKFLTRSINAIFVIFTFIAFLNIIFKINFMNYTHYPSMVPFTEPSQFAQYYGPISVIAFVIQRSFLRRLRQLLMVFAIAIIVPSLTLFVYCVIMTLLILKFRFIYIILISFLLSLFVYYILSNDHFISRLIISSDTDNLSGLVYLQGLHDIYQSLQHTNYLGLGFQLLGNQPPTEVSFLIEKIAGVALNRDDGGFLAAKVISEFGILGIALLAYYIVLGFTAFQYIRKRAFSELCTSTIQSLIVASMLVTFSVEVFVRGVGYFSPGVFMFLMAFCYYEKYLKSSFTNN